MVIDGSWSIRLFVFTVPIRDCIYSGVHCHELPHSVLRSRAKASLPRVLHHCTRACPTHALSLSLFLPAHSSRTWTPCAAVRQSVTPLSSTPPHPTCHPITLPAPELSRARESLFASASAVHDRIRQAPLDPTPPLLSPCPFPPASVQPPFSLRTRPHARRTALHPALRPIPSPACQRSGTSNVRRATSSWAVERPWVLPQRPRESRDQVPRLLDVLATDLRSLGSAASMAAADEEAEVLATVVGGSIWVNCV